MNRLITSATAGCALATGLMIATPATAGTFVGDYDISTTGTVSVDDNISPYFPLLGLPTDVNISAASTGSFSIDPDRFLDGDLTFALDDLGSGVSATSTAFLGSFLGLGQQDTASLMGLTDQLDGVFDYTLSGSGSFTSASADESFAIAYDGGLNEVIIDGFDASSCLTETCIGSSITDFSLSVNIPALGVFIDSLAALPLSSEAQQTLTTIRGALPLFGTGDVSLLAGSFTTNFEVSPTALLSEGVAGNYGVLAETGEVTVTESVTGATLFEQSLTEPVAFGTVVTVPDDTTDATDVPEPGILLGLVAVGGLAWSQRQRTEKVFA